MPMKETEIPRLGQKIEPNKLAILEFDEAIKDKSGRKAVHIILGETDHEWRKKIRKILQKHANHIIK